MPGFSWNLSRRAREGLERVMPSQGREEETARCSGRREELRGKVHLKSIHCCRRCKIHCIFRAVQMQGSSWILSRRGEDAKQRTERSQRGQCRKVHLHFIHYCQQPCAKCTIYCTRICAVKYFYTGYTRYRVYNTYKIYTSGEFILTCVKRKGAVLETTHSISWWWTSILL